MTLSRRAASRLPASPGLCAWLLHLGEAELRIGEWETPLGLSWCRDERIVLVFLLDLYAAAMEQLQFTVEGAQADGQGAQDRVPFSRAFGEELDQVMEPRSASEGDMHGGASATSRPFHGDDSSPGPYGPGPGLRLKGRQVTRTDTSLLEVSSPRRKEAGSG